MDHKVFNLEFFNCAFSIGTCLVLSVLYVSSLYVWNSQHDRNHPITIKRRFVSVFVIMLISPFVMTIALQDTIWEKATISEILGIRIPGLLLSTIMSLVLTMVLFLGPLCMHLQNVVWTCNSDLSVWIAPFKDLIWWRNYVVAPLSEEFTFRACMLPILLQCFRPIFAIFICPLFFGVAHLHHIMERINSGMDLKTSLILSFFQLFYSTLFGAYSAYLFTKTGHLMSSFIAHAFCNYMGFPDFGELLAYQGVKRVFIGTMFVVGLVLWWILLVPLMNSKWYSNDLYMWEV